MVNHLQKGGEGLLQGHTATGQWVRKKLVVNEKCYHFVIASGKNRSHLSLQTQSL